jgi:hypothetical protein
MLPRLVGGAELSFTARLFVLGLFHDQLPKLSLGPAPLVIPFPFVVPLWNEDAGGVAGRDSGCCCDEADWSEYEDRDSLSRRSSGPGIPFGLDGHWVDGGPEEDGNGGGGCWWGCQPWARMSAEVCRRARLPGGSSTLARG